MQVTLSSANMIAAVEIEQLQGFVAGFKEAARLFNAARTWLWHHTMRVY